MHRIFACNYNLYIWGKSDSNLCRLCNNLSVDDIVHYFYGCNFVKPFWRSICNFWSTVYEVKFPLSEHDIIFGILNPNGDTTIDSLNYIILLAKYCIFKCKSDDCNLALDILLGELKAKLEIKQYIMYKNGKNTTFDKIWSPLLDKL